MTHSVPRTHKLNQTEIAKKKKKVELGTSSSKFALNLIIMHNNIALHLLNTIVHPSPNTYTYLCNLDTVSYKCKTHSMNNESW